MFQKFFGHRCLYGAGTLPLRRKLRRDAHAAAACPQRLISLRALRADRQLQTHRPKGHAGLPIRQVEDSQIFDQANAEAECP
jgi:hypothetical protein